jgi:glutathione S-transferase
MSDLTLWVDAFWISPYAFSSFVALEEKRLPYAVETVALQRGEQRAGAYAARSLTARLPMLRHGDFHLSESSAIAEYLEEAFPDSPRLVPEGLRARAHARQVMAWLRSDLMPIRVERGTETIFHAPAKAPLSPMAEENAARLIRTAEALLPDGATALFGRFSLADADLTLMLQRLARSGHPLTPGLRRFVDAVWARPSVQAFVTHARPAYEPY